MAIGSAEEAKLWCAYARDLGFVEAATVGTWQSGYAEIARMLHGLLKHLPPRRERAGLEPSRPESED